MKKKFRLYLFLLIGASIFLNYSCKKSGINNPPPTPPPTPTGLVPLLATNSVGSITSNSATCGGNISSDGGSAVIARGVCWSLGTTPTISDSTTNDRIGIGSFTSSITGLTTNTMYYVRAYATNSTGTGYGSILSFKTALLAPQIPILITSTLDSIKSSSATCGGNITSDGGATVTARGVCWSLAMTPSVADSTTTDGTSTGNFVSTINGLVENSVALTTYFHS